MIVPLTLDDANIIAFNMREVDVREIMAMRRDEYRHEFAEECMIWGGWCCKDTRGVPYAMGGVVEHWPGVGTAWMVATDAISQHGVEVTKAAKTALVTNKNLHRIQAYSADFHDVSHAWLELLGFTRGHTVRKLGKNGENFILFEIVRD